MKNLAQADIRVATLLQEFYPADISSTETELFCVKIDGEYLETPNDNLIYHENKRALRELAAELEYVDSLDVTQISLYNLCSTQLEFYNQDSNPFIQETFNFRKTLLNDNSLRTYAGPEVLDQLKYLQTIVDYLDNHQIAHPHLPQMYLENDEWLIETGTKENFDKLVDLLIDEIGSFNNYQLTVFVTTAHVYDSPLLGVLLAKKKITSQELSIIHLISIGIYSKLFGDVDRSQEQEIKKEIVHQGDTMLRYLELFSPQKTEIEKIIEAGESTTVEFKSTLRWNIKAKRIDKKMEHAVLKSIVAFLNTDGGTLLVGVEDDGNLLGIELDDFPNEDKYLLHFTNLVNGKIGKEISEFIKYELKNAKDQKVLFVKCAKSPTPVLLNFDKQEEFYVRTGPASVALSMSQMLGYIKTRFS